MQCSHCGAVSPPGFKFCGVCGTALPTGCRTCGTVNPGGMKFCGECGTSLAAVATNSRSSAEAPPFASVASPEASSSVSGAVAERRVCSVVFCDLVGFTPLSEARDPEEVRELLSRYFEVARTIIGRYGGVVEKFIGDAVMAVWGTPTATEEDGERAVRAALELVDAVDQLGRDAGAAGLAARAGVVTGAVAVSVGATGEGMVAGDAVNTAARVQAAAEPGTVLVDEGTRRVAEAAVGFAAAGDHVLKGKAEPVSLWKATRVVAGAGGSQRIDGLEAGFIGRDAELRLVKELFHACEQRRSPRLVSVTGAAGVGKSRLGWEFRKYIDGLLVTVWWHQGRCLSYGDGVAFWALAEMVRQRLQIAEEDSSSEAAHKLAIGLDELLTDPAERAYVGQRLAQLLGVEYGDPGPVLGREELFAGWRLFFERLGATGPVVMVVEDLQHADVGLLDFLEHLLDWARDVPIFVLTLARPELETHRAGWATARRNSTALTLDPLDESAMDALLGGLVPGMPAEGKTAIAARAEGIPLYAVETVRMLIDRDIVQPLDGVYRLVGDVGELSVPATLQSLLAARLDALEPEQRRLVADAAVLGSTFPADALVAVCDLPELDVRRLVAELVRREVLGVRADPLSPQRGQYTFVQTMFRQVAYDTLSRRERKARHLAVAAHLRSTFADEGEEIAEVIATHLLDALAAVPDDPDVAELRAETATMLTRAGERAERTGAPTAAANAYTAAANLLSNEASREAEIGAAALLERAGAATNTSSDFPKAAERFSQSADLYRRHSRLRDAARADTQVGAVLRRQGRHEEARQQLRAALEVLQAEPDGDTVTALAELAALEGFIGNTSDAFHLSATAFSQAEALGLSDTVFAELFVIRGIVLGMASQPVQAAANLREAVRRAEAAQDSAAVARAQLNLGDTLLSTDPHASVEAAHAAMFHARRIGYLDLVGFTAGNLIQALLMTGDWEAARQVQDSVASEDELGEYRPLAMSAAVLYAFSGDEVKLQVALTVLGQDETEDPQDRAMSATAFAAAAALAEDHSEAFRHASRAVGHGTALGPRNDGVRWAWPIAADAALALGDEAQVNRLLDWLGGYPPGHIPQVLRTENLRIRARMLGVGNDPTAGAAFQAALAACRQLGSPYHLAVGLLDNAEYSAAVGDTQRAEQLADEAGAIAQILGAQPLVGRVQRLNTSPPDRVTVGTTT